MAEGVRTIGSQAFGYNTQLKTINLPSSITKISTYIFNNCIDANHNSSTITINYNGTYEQWSAIDIAESWEDYCYGNKKVICTNKTVTYT